STPGPADRGSSAGAGDRVRKGVEDRALRHGQRSHAQGRCLEAGLRYRGGGQSGRGSNKDGASLCGYGDLMLLSTRQEEAMSTPGNFVADIKGIRQRARQQLGDGAVTNNYGGKIEDAITLLNHAVATEIVCVLRYKFHAVCAAGLASEAVKEEFAQ